MNDKDRTTAPEHTAETPSPGQPRPEEGAPAPAGESRHGVKDGARALDSNGAAEIQGDLDELVKVAAERDEYLALAQRTQADFENYRKRVAREAAGAQERGVAGLAKELLPALDNLDRAIGAADANDPLLKGVQLVRSELAAALARVGIESFRPEGERFDPSLHEAVATAPAGEGGASGAVLEVYQDGYRLGESILRPARVVVSA
ncbi:MAG TPA: nucleotide exchange factor GrpE [Solirubrobacteraceae bacterium]